MLAGWSNLSFDGRWANLGVILLPVYLVALVTTYSRAMRASCMYPAAASRSPTNKHTTRMQRLSPQDACFLHLEDAVSHMHIGAVAILEGPPPPYDALAERVRANLPQVPRCRQKVHFVPLALSRSV